MSIRVFLVNNPETVISNDGDEIGSVRILHGIAENCCVVDGSFILGSSKLTAANGNLLSSGNISTVNVEVSRIECMSRNIEHFVDEINSVTTIDNGFLKYGGTSAINWIILSAIGHVTEIIDNITELHVLIVSLDIGVTPAVPAVGRDTTTVTEGMQLFRGKSINTSNVAALTGGRSDGGINTATSGDIAALAAESNIGLTTIPRVTITINPAILTSHIALARSGEASNLATLKVSVRTRETVKNVTVKSSAKSTRTSESRDSVAGNVIRIDTTKGFNLIKRLVTV